LDAVVDAQQIEAGKAGFVLGPTDLQAIVRDVCQYHRSALRDGVELAVSVAADVPRIVTDAPRVGQVRAPECAAFRLLARVHAYCVHCVARLLGAA
jgi:hypothetical protein